MVQWKMAGHLEGIDPIGDTGPIFQWTMELWEEGYTGIPIKLEQETACFSRFRHLDLFIVYNPKILTEPRVVDNK